MKTPLKQMSDLEKKISKDEAKHVMATLLELAKEQREAGNDGLADKFLARAKEWEEYL